MSRARFEAVASEFDALVAEIDEKLAARADNPLLVIEQLRGRVLRFQRCNSPCRFDKWLNRFQDYCDERHLALCRHPEIERWRTELVAYERAAFLSERQARAR